MSKNAEGWIRHRGGKAPVSDDVFIDVRYRDGEILKLQKFKKSEAFLWAHHNGCNDIMAYKLHKPAEQVDDNADLKAAAYDAIQPLQWRDRITEIDATTQALTAERAELVQKLASEGFALIGRINELLTDAAQKHEDMSDWRNWKKGDLIECTGKSGGYSPGSIYTVKSINHDRGVVHTVTDDSGSITNGWGGNMFIWKSRPSA